MSWTRVSCLLLSAVVVLAWLSVGRAAPQTLGAHNVTGAEPTGHRPRRPHPTAPSPGRRQPDPDGRPDPPPARGHPTGAALPPLVEGGRETLTKLDLSKLPLDNNTYHIPKPRHPQLGCKMLQSKMQISDGFCTSIEPVKSVICEGNCLPEQDLPWFAQFMKLWGRTKVIDYVCEDDVIRRKRVELICENGETRRIRIKVVRSCKCTRLVEPANRPLANKHRYSTKVVDEEAEPNGDRERTNRKHRRRKHRGRRRKKKDKRRRKKDKKRARGRQRQAESGDGGGGGERTDTKL